MLGYQGEGPDWGQIVELCHRGYAVLVRPASPPFDCGVADRHHRIKGGDLCGEAVEINELIDFACRGSRGHRRALCSISRSLAMSPYCSETKFADDQPSNGAQLFKSGRTLLSLLLHHEMPRSGPWAFSL